MNKKLTLERPELHPVPVKSPWHHLGMDFVGPISPPSQSGNQYILTLSDYFTKFAWAKAMPTKEAMNVVSALREVSTVILCHHFIPIIIYVAISNFLFLFASIFQLFFIMGLPSVMTMDQGREFHNRCWLCGPEKGFHQEEAQRWQIGLPLARAIRHQCITRERAFQAEGA